MSSHYLLFPSDSLNFIIFFNCKVLFTLCKQFGVYFFKNFPNALSKPVIKLANSSANSGYITLTYNQSVDKHKAFN